MLLRALYGFAFVAVNAEIAWGADLSDLRVEPEHRCAPYSARAHSYPSDLDRRHVEALGYDVDSKGKISNSVPSPYTPGIAFRYLQDMDIEHIVARSEAHDSGLCADKTRWREFAGDPLNITIAAEHVNRTLKRDRDPADWLPDINRCWFAQRVVDVKAKYQLSVDQREHDALAAVLEGCD